MHETDLIILYDFIVFVSVFIKDFKIIFPPKVSLANALISANVPEKADQLKLLCSPLFIVNCLLLLHELCIHSALNRVVK